MENQWLSAAKRLHALAQTGLGFTKDEFDAERYEEIGLIARQLLASLADVSVSTIQNLVCTGAIGYETPKIDVRGAEFRDNKILLVKEKSDGLWTLPGGYADVGLSPSANIEKEILEEACLAVKASQLIFVRHKASGAYDPDVIDYYKLFFLCEAVGSCEVQAGSEVSDAAYFPLDGLPHLCTSRVLRSDLEDAWKWHEQAMTRVAFD